MKIGIIHETKVPVDKRVLLLPEAVKEIIASNTDISIAVQKSPTRCASDEQYESLGVNTSDHVDDCDLLIGVKEVSIKELIPKKTYMFFSHTTKKQPYNRDLLRAILEKEITLIDYEPITDDNGHRLISFGRYAGIVGAYNAFWTLGKRQKSFDLERATSYKDEKDLIKVLQEKKSVLPPNLKIVLTGSGRVGKGSKEILDGMGIKQVDPQAYLTETFDEPVYTHISSLDYYKLKEGTPSDENNFYKYPQHFEADFYKYAQQSDILISAHFWNTKAAPLFTAEQMKQEDFKITVIADITCDIQGSIPSTSRPCTIEEPVFDYDPTSQTEQPPFASKNNISVMSIDNLPCELPVGASKMFGEMFVKDVLPHLLNGDKNEVIKRATIAKDGKLTEAYQYLQEYVS